MIDLLTRKRPLYGGRPVAGIVAAATGLVACTAVVVSTCMVEAASALPAAPASRLAAIADRADPPRPDWDDACPPSLTCTSDEQILASGVAPSGATDLSVSLVPPMGVDDSTLPAALGADDPEPDPDDATTVATYQIVPLTDVSVDLSSADGEFTISASPASVPDDYIGDQGLVNLRIVANANGRQQLEERTVRMARPVGGAVDAAYWVDPNLSDNLLVDEPASTTDASRLDRIPQLDTSLATADDDVSTLTWSRGADAEIGTAASAADDPSDGSSTDPGVDDAPTAGGGPALESWATLPQPPDGAVPAVGGAGTCYEEELDTHHYVMAQIGATYTQGNSKGHRAWSGSQTTTVSTAVSASGAGGTFNASGSTSFSRGSTFSLSWSGGSGEYSYKVEASWHKFRVTCGSIYYEYRPILYTGGNSEHYNGTSIPTFSHCVSNSADSFSRTNSTGESYSMIGGVSFPVLGATLNSEKAYAVRNGMYYAIASPYDSKEICGDDRAPSLSRRVEIRVK